MGRYPYGFVQEFDVQRSENAIRVIAFGRPPASVSLLISECLHNLRSALDNFVYDLALAYNRGNPLLRDAEDRAMLPIFGSQKEFKRRGAYRIRDIDPGAKAVIEGLQPYERGNPDYLWELNELSRIDKHRLLHVTLLGMHESVLGGTQRNTIVDNITFSGGAIEPFGPGTVDGTELVRYRATPVDPSDKMHMYFQFVFDIAFDQDSPVSGGEPVLRRLWTLRNYIIDNVVLPLTPYLTRIRLVRVSQPYSLLTSRG